MPSITSPLRCTTAVPNKSSAEVDTRREEPMFYANVRPAQAPSGKTPQHHSTGVFTQGDFEFKHASKSNVSSNIATDVALVASSSLCELKAMAAFSVCCLVLDKLKKLVIFLSRIWVGRTDENCPPLPQHLSHWSWREIRLLCGDYGCMAVLKKSMHAQQKSLWQ